MAISLVIKDPMEAPTRPPNSVKTAKMSVRLKAGESR